MTNKAKCRGLYACMGEWPDGGWLPDVAASWRVLTDGIGSGELTVGFCQLARVWGAWLSVWPSGFRSGRVPTRWVL